MKILFALSWGHQFPRPGLSNEFMAREILKIKAGYDLLLVQREIGDSLEQFGVRPDFIIGRPGVYVNTYGVVKEMIERVRTKNINLEQHEISVVCHRTHWSGVKLVFKKFKIKGKRAPLNVPYDPDSLQWYTRNSFMAFLGKITRSWGYFFRREI